MGCTASAAASMVACAPPLREEPIAPLLRRARGAGQAQEEQRQAKLEEMKAKQLRAEKAGQAVGPYKRYLDDSIIEKNFQQREAAVEQAEAAAKAKAKALRQDLKAHPTREAASPAPPLPSGPAWLRPLAPSWPHPPLRYPLPACEVCA